MLCSSPLVRSRFSLPLGHLIKPGSVVTGVLNCIGILVSQAQPQPQGPNRDPAPSRATFQRPPLRTL